ncbi:hypothetical protein, partial [Nonomuraea cypriaca]|uniref:hypothetical protein n=1 Tax=Nonomuraea cypriaca TaxID=1187855 RepID=UPI001A9CA9B8
VAEVTGGGGLGGMLVLEPVLVPAPDHPDRVYEGRVSAPVRAVAKPQVVELRVEAKEVPPVEETDAPAPVEPQVACPGEWEETWLWELCRDREDEAVRGDRESWVPGI